MNQEWHDHMREIASKGGQATKKKGSAYFKAIRKKRKNYTKKKPA